MERRRFDEMNCGIARALEALGDKWTLLIVRNAFFGMRRFADFESDLEIAKNVLTTRLQHLVDHDVLERVDVGRQGSRFEYRLTEKGEALLPVLTTLREWSEDWVFGRGNEPLIVRERRSQRRVPKLRLRDAAGRPLLRRDLRMVIGPGATEETIARFRRPEARPPGE